MTVSYILYLLNDVVDKAFVMSNILLLMRTFLILNISETAHRNMQTVRNLPTI